MNFSDYVKTRSIPIEDESVAANIHCPIATEFSPSIINLLTFNDTYFEKPLPFVSKAEMSRIKNIYNYLFENQDVTCEQFYNMLKEEPKYKAVLDRYPNSSFEETLEALVEKGPRRFAIEINEKAERKLDKSHVR